MKAKTLSHGLIALPYELYRRLELQNDAWIEAELDEKTGCIILRPVHRKYSFIRTSWKRSNRKSPRNEKMPTK